MDRSNFGFLLAATCLALALGCAGTRDGHARSPISRSRALELAVAMANEECMHKFSVAPFDSSTASIEFKNDHWHWGGLDLAGEGGLSAYVTFDVEGKDRRVEVYLSTDQLQGVYE